MNQLEKLHGSVERVTFHSDESGFCVLRIKTRGQRDLVTVVGNAASINPGEYVEAYGFWVNDKRHGLQFKAQELKVIPPSTLEGIEKYLASGMIKGIGPHFAKKLVKTFGEKVFDVIEKQPNKLTKLPGIGEKRKAMVITAWVDQKAIRDIMVFLQSHGVGTARAVRIYKTYGDQAIAKVQNNPYCLALDVHGIGFITADTIAGRLGIAKDSLMRACAGIRHVLQELSSEGHCAAFVDDLKKKSVDLLEIPELIIDTAIDEEVNAGNLIAETIDDKPALFLASLYQAEVSVAKHLQRIQCGDLPWGEIDCEKAIPWVEKITALRLSTSQRQAIIQAVKSKVMIITGGPGVGKTTIVNSILKIVRAKGASVSLCAPTGRAAKRLSEATRITAKTIHRLLEFDPKSFAFRNNSTNPLITDLVVVDEVSMLDIVLMNHLLKAIPNHAALLMVGDVNQLPSVGPGALLSDLIQSDTIPTVLLTDIFRQAANSRIIINAHRINQGKLPIAEQHTQELTDFYMMPTETPEEIYDKLLQVVIKRIPQRFKFNPIRDIQILTPMHRGGIGTRSLNIALQEKLNSASEPKITRFGSTFAPGDKVIQNINNYDKEVFNGDIGNITSIDLEESTLKINFDGRLVDYEFSELDEISLAYATSIHKSQGSEYPVVVIPLAMQHYVMLARNLIYTAVTRGKQLVIIIGQPKALAIAVRNNKTNKRITNLCARLQQGIIK
ncbi:MAG: recombinase RecD [Coxiella sp. DG_40]|nr:MAG: recombinase RecD [Coxiella sp. DG_40]